MDVKFVDESLPGLVQKFGTGLIQNMLKASGVNPPTGLIKDKLKRNDIVITFNGKDFERIDTRYGFFDNIVPKNVVPISQIKRESIKNLLLLLRNKQTPEQNIIVNIELKRDFEFFIPGKTEYNGQVNEFNANYDSGLQEDVLYMLNWFPKKNMHGIKYNKVTINFNGDVCSGVMRIRQTDPYHHHRFIAEAILEKDLYPFIAVREYQTFNINGKNSQNAKVKYI